MVDIVIFIVHGFIHVFLGNYDCFSSYIKNYHIRVSLLDKNKIGLFSVLLSTVGQEVQDGKAKTEI
jgi:hypothetical protein